MRLQSEDIWDLNIEDAFAYMSGALDGDSRKLVSTGMTGLSLRILSSTGVSSWPLHVVSPGGQLGFLHGDLGLPKGLSEKWKLPGSLKT